MITEDQARLLKEYSELPLDWGENGSIPISQTTINTATKLLYQINPILCSLLDVTTPLPQVEMNMYPAMNGQLIIDYESTKPEDSNRTLLSIGIYENTMDFFTREPDKDTDKIRIYKHVNQDAIDETIAIFKELFM